MINPDQTESVDEYRSQRTRLLKNHIENVLEARQRAKRVIEELIEREVRVNVMDGMSPRLAEQAAKWNVALRIIEVEAELDALLEYHKLRLVNALEAIRPIEDDE